MRNDSGILNAISKELSISCFFSETHFNSAFRIPHSALEKSRADFGFSIGFELIASQAVDALQAGACNLVAVQTIVRSTDILKNRDAFIFARRSGEPAGFKIAAGLTAIAQGSRCLHAKALLTVLASGEHKNKNGQ